MTAADQERFVRRALELAKQNVRDGQRPYGAVVARDGVVLAEGVNRVLATGDPTAHAETEAVRAAAAALGSEHLIGAVLYSSCSPCRMCRTVAQLVGITHIIHAGECDSRLRIQWPDLQVDALDDPAVSEPFELMRNTVGDLNAGRRVEDDR